jgi:Helix-turn-helix of DDE superfamily endonuclease
MITTIYGDQPTTANEKLEYTRLYIHECEANIAALEAERFCIDRFTGNNKMITFYTAFKSYETLKAFFHCFAPHLQTMKTWAQVSKAGVFNTECRQAVFSTKIHPFDQLFMFMHKLRLGSSDQDIADRFFVSQATVSRNTITWANLLYVILGSQRLWPSRE